MSVHSIDPGEEGVIRLALLVDIALLAARDAICEHVSDSWILAVDAIGFVALLARPTPFLQVRLGTTVVTVRLANLEKLFICKLEREVSGPGRPLVVFELSVPMRVTKGVLPVLVTQLLRSFYLEAPATAD